MIVESTQQLVKSRCRINQHSWFRLKGQVDVACIRHFAKRSTTINKPRPVYFRFFLVNRRSRPKTNALSVQCLGNPDGTFQKLQPVFALPLIRANQRGLMFSFTVQEES